LLVTLVLVLLALAVKGISGRGSGGGGGGIAAHEGYSIVPDAAPLRLDSPRYPNERTSLLSRVGDYQIAVG
jgi:hypothetical protein